jgi:hypothetical protein
LPKSPQALPNDVVKTYIEIAVKENQNDEGLYGIRNLSELTSINSNKFNNALKGKQKGKFTLQEIDAVSVHSTFCLQEVEADLISKYPEWEKIINE